MIKTLDEMLNDYEKYVSDRRSYCLRCNSKNITIEDPSPDAPKPISPVKYYNCLDCKYNWIDFPGSEMP